MKEDTTMADSIVTPAELLSKLAESREFDFFREAMLGSVPRRGVTAIVVS